MKITVIGENFYQIKEFQAFLRIWVRDHDEKLLISFDCCPISLFLVYNHLKYDHQHHIKYLIAKYLPTYYQSEQISKFLIENLKKIKNNKIVLCSSYTNITDIQDFLDEFDNIGRDTLDEIDLALINSCNMIRNFMKTYKEKSSWEMFNDYQKQSSIVLSKLSQELSRYHYHLVIYTNFINAYTNNLIIDNRTINFKSLVSYWADRFTMDIIYLLGKSGKMLDIYEDKEIDFKFKEKHFNYFNNYLPFPDKNKNIITTYAYFKDIVVDDRIKIKL